MVPLVQGPLSRVYTLTVTSFIRSNWALYDNLGVLMAWQSRNINLLFSPQLRCYGKLTLQSKLFSGLSCLNLSIMRMCSFPANNETTWTFHNVTIQRWYCSCVVYLTWNISCSGGNSQSSWDIMTQPDIDKIISSASLITIVTKPWHNIQDSSHLTANSHVLELL